MPLLVDQVLPYLKASAADDVGPVVELDAESSPVLVPFIGSLLVSYVVDEGDRFRYVTEGEREALGLSNANLRHAAEANLKAKIESTGVRLARHGKCLAVLFEGNFEATLLLWEDLVTYARHELGSELVA